MGILARPADASAQLVDSLSENGGAVGCRLAIMQSCNHDDDKKLNKHNHKGRGIKLENRRKERRHSTFSLFGILQTAAEDEELYKRTCGEKEGGFIMSIICFNLLFSFN